MTLTDRPVDPDTPRQIAAVVRIAYVMPIRWADEVFTMSMNTHDMDPEWRFPLSQLTFMLDATDPGKACVARLNELADAYLDRNAPAIQSVVTATVDGKCIYDGPGDEALAEIVTSGLDAARALANP